MYDNMRKKVKIKVITLQNTSIYLNYLTNFDQVYNLTRT